MQFIDRYHNLSSNSFNENPLQGRLSRGSFCPTFGELIWSVVMCHSEICEIIHHHGGQVYLDGANMNAQVKLIYYVLYSRNRHHWPGSVPSNFLDFWDPLPYRFLKNTIIIAKCTDIEQTAHGRSCLTSC